METDPVLARGAFVPDPSQHEVKGLARSTLHDSASFNPCLICFKNLSISSNRRLESNVKFVNKKLKTTKSLTATAVVWTALSLIWIGIICIVLGLTSAPFKIALNVAAIEATEPGMIFLFFGLVLLLALISKSQFSWEAMTV